MYKLSYEKCVCFVFLVILVFLSCSGFHTDRLVTLTDLNNKRYTYPYPYPFTSTTELAGYELIKEIEMNATHSNTPLTPRFYRRRRHAQRSSRYRNSINTIIDHKPLNQNQKESPNNLLEIRERRSNSKGHHQNGKRRKNERRFCPGQDVGTRAFHAKIIIEGRVRSMNKNSNDYAVTVEVKKIHRNESNFRVLNITDMIRLHFAKRPPKRCDQRLVNGLVPAQLDNGKYYIFFLKSVGVHNYTVIGQPVLYDEKKVQQIQDVVHKKGVRAAKIVRLRIANENLKPGGKLNLTCLVRGNPPPIVTWYKDGVEIRGKQKRPRIKYAEKKSVLTIQNVEVSDGGKYECRAKGVIGKVVNSSATVLIQDPDPEGTPCDLPPNSYYCLNGGTCFRHITLGELSCRCSNGFNGQRCELKDVTSQTSTYTRSRTVYCKLGVSTTFYC